MFGSPNISGRERALFEFIRFLTYAPYLGHSQETKERVGFLLGVMSHLVIPSHSVKTIHLDFFQAEKGWGIVCEPEMYLRASKYTVLLIFFIGKRVNLLKFIDLS